MKPFKSNEQNNVVRLPGVRPEEAAQEVGLLQHILNGAIASVEQAAVTPLVEQEAQSIPEHLRQEPYYGQQAA